MEASGEHGSFQRAGRALKLQDCLALDLECGVLES